MKFYITFLIALVLMSSFVIAEERQCSYTFKQYDSVNFRFRCTDTSSNYCSSGTELLISIEYPDGTNALDNATMSYNATYFNISLPTLQLADKNSPYSAIVVSPNGNATTEFYYCVTTTGYASGSTIPLFLLLGGFLVLALAIYQRNEYIGFFSASVFIVAGLYMMRYGLGLFSDTYTQTIAYISFGIGLAVGFSSVFELITSNSGEAESED